MKQPYKNKLINSPFTIIMLAMIFGYISLINNGLPVSNNIISTAKNIPVKTQKIIIDKNYIEKTLKSTKGVSNICWSPNNSMVLYIKQVISASNTSLTKVYLWKVGEKNPKNIINNTSPTGSFIWSLDNNYFLISQKSSLHLLNKLFCVKDLKQKNTFNSSTKPVWSPDSLHLTASFIEEYENNPWCTIRIYTPGKTNSSCILRELYSYGPYTVNYWNKSNTIGYTKISSTGSKINKTIKVPKL